MTKTMRSAAGLWRLVRAMLAWGAAATLALGCATAGATVLTFDQGGAGGPVPEGYGDRVAAATVAVPGGSFTYGNGGEGFTPNVVVDLFTDGATPGDPHTRLWRDGYGDLVNVMFGEGPGITGAAQVFVRLLADPGFEVMLHGFDLAGFGGRDYVIAGIDVLAGATTLFAVSDLLVEGDTQGAGHTHVGFSVPLSAHELLIRIDVSNLTPGIRDNIGLDSVRFGQSPPPVAPVPEPSTWWLLATTLPVLLRRPPRRTRA
jgi:hypothetical protein